MKTIIGCIEEVMMEAFQASGYEEKFGKVTVSNRPDLCEYQCSALWLQPRLTERRRS